MFRLSKSYSPGHTASHRERLLNTTSLLSCHTAACVEPQELNTADGEEDVSYYSDSPNIWQSTCFEPADRFTYLRCTAEGRRGAVGFDVLLAQAEICEDDVALRVQQDVLRLQISVDDVEGVEVAQRAGDLRRVEPGSGLQEAALSLKVVEQLGEQKQNRGLATSVS